jgi:hypothetical protein
MTSRLLLVLLLVDLAHAHSVPIPPSLCSFDPLAITAPATGFQASAAPSGAADVFRIVYDPGASGAQLCAADPADPQNRCASLTPARAFAGGGVSGTLKLTAFEARVLASGDMIAAAVPLSFTLDGQTGSVSMPFTTGLLVAGDGVAEGSPIAADGSFTLVGTGTLGALGAPLGGTPLLVRMSCTAAPPPDLDQFVPPTQTTKVAGKISADGLRLRVVFRAGAEASAPDFGAPALLRVSAGGAAIGALSLPAGLQAEGRRKFVGESADGQGTVVVRRLRGASYKMTLRLTNAAEPSVAGATPIELAYQVGGLLSRGTRTFRLGRHGLHVP